MERNRIGTGGRSRPGREKERKLTGFFSLFFFLI